jgi:transcriptional regulator with XRE-family HTH domain
MRDDAQASVSEARRHTLANRVRVLRAGLGWSQERLAEESGVDRTTIGRLESARRGTTADTLWAVADAFGIPLADLVSDGHGHPIR